MLSTQPPQSHLSLHQRALELSAPPSMLVDTNYQVINVSDEAGRYVQPSGGQIRNDITELVRPELRFDVRTGLQRAFERNEASLSLPTAVGFNGTTRRVLVQVKPVAPAQGWQRQAVVFFIEGDAVEGVDAAGSVDVREHRAGYAIRNLKEELKLTRARLRASREEYEAAIEELRAANEELQSINEEHRSTAEELETSKEELQSINEELQTVNAELKTKFDNVSRTNNDLQNLMASTDVGTLFLNSQLCIKRFTPPISQLFNVKPSDEGRSIEDFTHHLDYPAFIADAQSVLKDLRLVEREVRAGESWYLTRLRPYRTVDDRIEGVVCTFIDITERLKTEDALRTSEARLLLLLHELSHRVKNTLAVVQSLARQSFGEGQVREEALEVFSDRLRALASAHDLLVGTEWRGAYLRDLIEKQIGPYTKLNGGRVKMRGPTVLLPPEIATPFGLVLHELATNAIKYGSLSKPEGTLRLEWGFSGIGQDRQLRFSWREKGGPPVHAPEKEGFGSWLIHNGLAEAAVTTEYPKDGAVCTLTISAKALGNP